MAGARESVELEEIDRESCLALLATEHLGRLGVVVDGRPVVYPMHYVLDGETVVLRTNPGAKHRAAPLSRVCFEVDHVDWARREGWSVLVDGTAQDITSTLDADSERRRALATGSWAPGPLEAVLEVVPREITGRRLRRR